eukprot:10295047-Prorocentrum_lima.AAC.1
MTTLPPQTLEYHVRAHLNSWNARAYLVIPLSQHNNVENITALLGYIHEPDPRHVTPPHGTI